MARVIQQCKPLHHELFWVVYVEVKVLSCYERCSKDRAKTIRRHSTESSTIFKTEINYSENSTLALGQEFLWIVKI